MRSIFTIGYEKADASDFIATLQSAQIDTLIDVRDVPVSRRKGFSKNSLRTLLEEAGIRYVHLRDLGDPKAGREAARRGDFETFRWVYNSHLASNEAQDALGQAVSIASNTSACLLCYERDNKNCHRTIVAEAMAAPGQFAVKHLGVRNGLGKERGYLGGERGQLRAVG